MGIYFGAPGCYRGWQPEQRWAKILSATYAEGLLGILQTSPKSQKKTPAFFLVSFNCWLLSTSFNSSPLSKLDHLLYKNCASRINPSTWIYKDQWPKILMSINSHSWMKDAVQVQKWLASSRGESPDQTGGVSRQAAQTAHLLLGLAHHVIWPVTSSELKTWQNLPLYFTISVLIFHSIR